VPLRYVESLSDARTKLADFFSILLSCQSSPRLHRGLDRNLIAGRECGRALHGERVAVPRSVCEVLFL
jgi:hypothetical protein